MVNLFLRGCAGVFLYAVLATASLAATGDWDYSYGTNGRVALTVPAGTFTVRTWRQQADGKIVAAGTAAGQNVVARFQENGTLDPSFDGDGVLTLPWPVSVFEEVGLELQPDGRLLVATHNEVYASNAYHSSFWLRRLNVDGSPDVTFGNGGEFFYFFDDYAYRSKIGLMPDGRILLVGVPSTSGGQSGRVTRLTAAGTFDLTFGTNGTAQLDVQNYFSVATFVVHPNGALTIGGAVGPFNSEVPYVARVTADGRFDSTFGQGGVLVLPFLSGRGAVFDLIGAPDGQVYVAGYRNDSRDERNRFIARVGTSGLLDPTFGSGGRIITSGEVASLTLEADGKLLAAGTINELASGLSWVARYNADGSPDVTFGLRGRSRLDFAHATAPVASYLRDVVRHPDGSYRALAVGNGSMMVRLLGSGTSPGVIGMRSSSTVPISERAGLLSPIYLYRTGGTDGVVSAQYRVVGDTATAGEDFVAATGTVTFNDGEPGLKPVQIELLDDEIREGEETFHVELFGPSGGAELSRARLDFSISAANDGDYGTRAAFVTETLSVTEGSSSARLIVRRTGSISRPLSVTYTATNSSMVGVDFDGAVGTIDWTANEGGTRIIEFPLIDDALAEYAEAFNVTLTSSTAGAIPLNGATASVVIVDNDDASISPALNFSTSSVRVNETATSVTLTVERMGNPASAITASWTTNASNAVAGQDFVAASGTLSWGAGDTAPRTIVISLLNDSLPEALESLYVTVTGDSQVQNPYRSVSVYIEDDEAGPSPPVINIAPGTSVNEGAGTATVTVTIAGVPQNTVSVDVRSATGTAATNDFSVPYATISWAAGDTSPRTVTVSIPNDTRDEFDETFFVYLSTPVNGAFLGTPVSTQFTIVDDDPTPPGQPGPVADGVRAPVSAITVREDQGSVKFQVERVGDPSNTLFVQYSVVSGDATYPGDYFINGGFLQWNANDVSARELELQLNGDTVAEPTETFTIRFSANPASPAEVTFTIIDDDSAATPARVGFVTAGHGAVESATTVTLQVGRTGNTTIASSVDYVTANGTAGGADFAAATGTLTWAANDTSMKLITVTLTPDTADEPDEAFTVSLRNASAGTEFDTATATVNIADDDVEVVAPSGGGGKGGGGGEESLIGLLLWGALASLRARPRSSRRGCFDRGSRR